MNIHDKEDIKQFRDAIAHGDPVGDFFDETGVLEALDNALTELERYRAGKRSPWVPWEEIEPPYGKLVLADYGHYFGLCSLTEDGDLYDENNDYDDSGETPERWMEIPA